MLAIDAGLVAWRWAGEPIIGTFSGIGLVLTGQVDCQLANFSLCQRLNLLI